MEINFGVREKVRVCPQDMFLSSRLIDRDIPEGCIKHSSLMTFQTNTGERKDSMQPSAESVCVEQCVINFSHTLAIILRGEKNLLITAFLLAAVEIETYARLSFMRLLCEYFGQKRGRERARVPMQNGFLNTPHILTHNFISAFFLPRFIYLWIVMHYL